MKNELTAIIEWCEYEIKNAHNKVEELMDKYDNLPDDKSKLANLIARTELLARSKAFIDLNCYIIDNFMK